MIRTTSIRLRAPIYLRKYNMNVLASDLRKYHQELPIVLAGQWYRSQCNLHSW
jgi:hypothetical protein